MFLIGCFIFQVYLFCIFALKDPGTPKEPATKALKQLLLLGLDPSELNDPTAFRASKRRLGIRPGLTDKAALCLVVSGKAPE